jgi:hypothetical protein
LRKRYWQPNEDNPFTVCFSLRDLKVSAMGPQINIVGSFFPSWMLCAVIGIVTAFAGRWLFVRAGLDPYLGPRRMVYPSLALLVTLVLWAALFRS